LEVFSILSRFRENLKRLMKKIRNVSGIENTRSNQTGGRITYNYLKGKGKLQKRGNGDGERRRQGVLRQAQDERNTPVK
jgi:hypothetical protein